VALFEIETVNKAAAFFDMKKLDHFNGEYIRSLTVDEFVARSEPFLRGDAVPWREDAFSPEVFAAMAPLVQERVRTLAEVPGYVDFLFLDKPVIDDKSWQKVMVSGRDVAVVMLEGMRAELAGCEWTAESIGAALFGFGEARGIGRSKAQAPVRVAVTGRSVGPPLLESLAVLGRERVLARVDAALGELR
jgi:glutamyl-tRNA synthetase